jgi:branched-chain amino acid transport system ATP-binding protein
MKNAAEQAPLILELEDFSVRYGKVEALHGVDLKVPARNIVAVIGPNGAGKSTMLNAIMGVLPSSGDVRYEGNSIVREDVEDRAMRGILLVPEKRELFVTMTVADNLKLGSFRRFRAREKDHLDQLDWIYQLFPRLKERHRQSAGTLSGGERQMLAIGRALMSKPELLMLDEPSLGLAPLVVREILRVISDLRGTGLATLLVEQNARAALQIADYGYVLERGTVVLEGPASELADEPAVIETYLGLAATKANLH